MFYMYISINTQTAIYLCRYVDEFKLRTKVMSIRKINMGTLK